VLVKNVFSMFQCSGVAVLVVGALGLGSPSTVVNALSYIPQISQLELIMYLPGISIGPSIYLTCAGSLAIILSFVGCGGAFKRSKCVIFVVCVLISVTARTNIKCVILVVCILISVTTRAIISAWPPEFSTRHVEVYDHKESESPKRDYEKSICQSFMNERYNAKLAFSNNFSNVGFNTEVILSYLMQFSSLTKCGFFRTYVDIVFV